MTILVSLLQDPSPDVRRTAAESLGKIGDGTAIPAVLPLLSDQVPLVRATAAQALGRMARPGDEAVVRGLIRSLQDPADHVKQAAALAIGDIEPPADALAPLAVLIKSADVRVKRAAVRALLALDTGPAPAWLLPALDDPDAEVRQGAVAALALSRDAHAGAALGKRLLGDRSPAVRAEAAYHLGELNGVDTRAVLRKAVQQETDEGVRRWIEAELKGLSAND